MKLNPLHTLILLTLLFTGTSALASAESDVQELIPLPHPIKVVMAHELELNITAEQMERMKEEVVGHFPPRMLPMMIEAEEMERRLAAEVMVNGKTKTELATDIDQLAALKRKLIDTHIDSLNTLKSILTDDQWTALLEILEKSKKI
jgi:hypothetical protein